MGLIGKLGGSLTQGVLGNMSEVSVDELTKEYGAYLMDGESIQLGFRLVRDVVLFTDKRIVDFDKQGATGQKMRVDSINLSSIIHVSAETSGFGLDDSEINISYISSPYYKANGGVSIGDGTIIGAGSVVTKDIPSGVIAAGNPCRVLRRVTEEDRCRITGEERE